MFLIELRKTRNKYASISKLSWRNHNFSQNSMLSKRRTCESLNRSKFLCLCVGSGCILSFQVHLAYLGLVIHPASRRRSSSFVYKSALLIRDSSIFIKGTLRLSVSHPWSQIYPLHCMRKAIWLLRQFKLVQNIIEVVLWSAHSPCRL